MRMQTLKGRTSADVKNFVQQHVEPGSTIITDGLTSYCCLADEGYAHKPMRKPDVGEITTQTRTTCCHESTVPFHW